MRRSNRKSDNVRLLKQMTTLNVCFCDFRLPKKKHIYLSFNLCVRTSVSSVVVQRGYMRPTTSERPSESVLCETEKRAMHKYV